MEEKKNKLYQLLSQAQGETVTIQDIDLTFKRFTISNMMSLEKDGIDLSELDTASAKGTEIMAKAIYNQLTTESQEQFGTARQFFECMTMDVYKIMLDAFMRTITNGMPDTEDTEKK